MNILYIIILFIFFYNSTQYLVGQSLIERNIPEKKAKELEHIVDCIHSNRKMDNLIEWKVNNSGKISSIYFSNGIVEMGLSYKYKSRWAFFILDKDTSGLFLKEINYFKNSFHKMIFLSDRKNKYQITNQTLFRVLMSNDNTSIYFCMINSDNVMIWIFVNGNDVYTYRYVFNK